jgi:hypothetical protein
MKNVVPGGGKKNVPNGATWAELYKILYQLLERRRHLMPYAREFKLIDDTLKDYFSGVPGCSIGEYKISGRPAKKCGGPKTKNADKDCGWVVEISRQNKK